MEKESRISRRDRKRVLLQSEQRSTDLTVLQTEVCEEVSTLRIEILIELCRGLIRENPSSDVLFFAVAHAQRATNATEEEMKLLAKAVAREANTSWWPKDFF